MEWWLLRCHSIPPQIQRTVQPSLCSLYPPSQATISLSSPHPEKDPRVRCGPPPLCDSNAIQLLLLSLTPCLLSEQLLKLSRHCPSSLPHPLHSPPHPA